VISSKVEHKGSASVKHKKSPQRWLIATDGSKYATMSVEYAANLYKQLEPKPQVMIITVIPDPYNTYTPQSDEGLKEEDAC
jgi:hypothetical protein